MPKRKLQIIVIFQNLQEEGREYYALSPAPPLSGALIAGLTPPIVEIELLHEMIRPINYETDADFIALSFMDYCAPHAIEVSEKFRALGKKVVAGGRYASTFPEKLMPHFDAVVVGEAEKIWPTVVEDLVADRLQKVYEAPFAPPLDNIPPPRYDLIEPQYTVPVVTEATRGCNFRCSFCHLTVKPTPYRTRPIPDVIRDLTATERLPFQKKKMAMLLDNNLGCDMDYAKALLREIAKLRLWGLGVQFSFDCLHDDEFIELLVRAHCTMAFIGLESLNEPSLSSVHKMHNKVDEYKSLFEKLRRNGILTFTGMMVGLDEDTPFYYEELPRKLDEIDPGAILPSIAIPIPGTPFHEKVIKEGRIVDTDLAHYEGDHLVFNPQIVTREQVFAAYRRINQYFYSWPNVFKRWLRQMTALKLKGIFFKRWIRAFFISFILIKLSLFERDHAKKKVYPLFK